MKILGIVVCYHPNVKELYFNINQYIDYVDRLIIWQNSPNIEREFSIIEKDDINKRIIFMGKGDNQGIAYPLNVALRIMFSENDNYTHLLTMDQDSTWENFEHYKFVIENISEDAIFSPNINNEIVSNESYVKVKTCITSGAIFTKKVLSEIGSFNEDYSVDCVDYDFCFKAKDKGYSIYKITSAKLNQIYGIPLKSKFFKFQTNVYSSKRLFFIVRNHILLWKDYPNHIDLRFAKLIFMDMFLVKLLKVLLMEKSKYIKIKSMVKGFFYGLVNNRSIRY